MACIAQSVNVISPLMTSPDGLLFQATYYPLRFFSRLMKDGHLLDLGYRSELYHGPTYPTWTRHIAPPAYVDIVALLNKDQTSVRISILNRHPEADWQCSLALEGFVVEGVEVHEMYSEDLLAKNTWEDKEKIKPVTRKVDGTMKELTVKKHSFVFVVLTGRVVRQ